MLKCLVLREFQCHQYLRIEFDEHITTIVGPSDVGKSSIFRALRYLVLNQPSGDAFVRDGASAASIALSLDGRTVRRQRGGKQNLYKLDGSSYLAFGQGAVPEEISKLLNLGEVNFQDQLAGPYWFMEGPAQVARNLNRIVNLDAIDRVTFTASSLVRSASATVEVSQERLLKARRNKAALAWILRLEKDLTNVEQLEYALGDKSHRIASVERSLSEATTLASRVDRASDAILAGRAAIQAGSATLQRRQRAKTLEELITNIEQTELRANNIPPDLGPLLAERGQADKVAERRRDLEMLLEDLEHQEAEECRMRKDHQKWLRELTRKLEGRCSVCGQKLPK